MYGPTTPEGLESNWIKTISGNGFLLYFRLFGLKKEFFDLSWTLDDLKKN